MVVKQERIGLAETTDFKNFDLNSIPAIGFHAAPIK